ncbi:efflux transporter periplasmic adaptor subunit [Enterobacterales bacterium CwR94]|nr:efflux transporter periplasmic adaptor subunit [Enterobacterales bacterium CwR94]
MTLTSGKRHLLLSALLLFLLLVAAAIWLAMQHHHRRTDDAWITADYTLVAPRVAGYVQRIYVTDNQSVKAGELLAEIDDSDYRVALESALASLAQSSAKKGAALAQLEQQQAIIDQSVASVAASEATLNYAGQNADRYRRLLQSGTATADEQQKANASQREASANVQKNRAAVVAARKQVGILAASVRQAEADQAVAQAAVDKAKLNVAWTKITAPVDGVIGQRALRQGAWVSAGTRLLAVVPLQHSYVTANFLETQLPDVSIGQPVNIRVDALPGYAFSGHIDSIAPATGATFSAIAADNATGNFTKIVQRLPVKITLDPGQKGLDKLRVGMSVVPEIQTN